MADIQFENIEPYVDGQGDTGLSSRQKWKRNFDKIKAWMDSVASSLASWFLRKDQPDTARETITFQKGAKFGTYTTGPLGTGGAVVIDQAGNSSAEFDYITIRKAATFRELTIKELRHVGGEIVLSAAAMKCSKVEPLDPNMQPIAADSPMVACYKCYFETNDAEGNQQVFQEFVKDDLARCQTFGSSVGESSGYTSTRYYWRKVLTVGEDYIILGNGSGDKDDDCTSAPAVGDNIVQLGYVGDDKPYRQSAIILSATDTDAPSMKFYQGINSFALPTPVKDEGYDPESGVFHSNIYGDFYVGDENGHVSYDSQAHELEIKGKVQMTADSTVNGNVLSVTLAELEGSAADAQVLAYGAQNAADNAQASADAAQTSATVAQTTANNASARLDDLSTGNENLIVNGGFAGTYTSENVDEDIWDDVTEIFSNPFGRWPVHDGCTIVTRPASATGKACQMSGGRLEQTLSREIIIGQPYTLSLLALSAGTISVSIGGFSGSLSLLSGQRSEAKFTASSTDNTLVITGSGVFTEIQLVQGNLTLKDWIPSIEDNSKYLAYFRNLAYLMEAISNGSTDIIGGLILTMMIRVGNYVDKQMTQETGGMSGVFTNDDDPFLWGGGSMTQALATIAAYANDPTFEPDPSDVANMAKFVVTHGGRAILTDIIARGMIIATAGIFRNISTPNGNFSIDALGNMSCQNAKISGNMFTPLTVINEDNFDFYVDSVDIDSDATSHFTWRSGGTNSTHQAKTTVSTDATTGETTVTINNNSSGGRFGMLVSGLPVGIYKISFDVSQDLLGGAFYTNYNNSTDGKGVADTVGGASINVEHGYSNGHYYLYIEKKTSGTFFIAFAVTSQSPNAVGTVINITNFRVTKRKQGRSFGQYDTYAINLSRTGLNVQLDFMPADAVIELPHDDAFVGAHFRLYNNTFAEAVYAHFICRISYDEANVYTFERTHILGHAFPGNYVELLCFDDTTVEEGSTEWRQKWVEIARAGNEPQYEPTNS